MPTKWGHFSHGGHHFGGSKQSSRQWRAYFGSEFEVVDPWRDGSWSQMKLTLAKVLARKYQHIEFVLYLTLSPLGATFVVC